MSWVSRGGLKLDHGLKHFQIDVQEKVCVDLGSNVGGFVDCLLEHQAKKVYSVDTSYGTLAWKLRQDDRVDVCERCNALHFCPDESIDLVTIDVGWTPQEKILPHVWSWLETNGEIISLLKPQYESSEEERSKGKVNDESLKTVVNRTLKKLVTLNLPEPQITQSPISGQKGNIEYLLYFKKLI